MNKSETSQEYIMNKIRRLLDVTPKVKILTLGADSQGQNFDLGSQLAVGNL